jgi:hypothetical protein
MVELENDVETMRSRSYQYCALPYFPVSRKYNGIINYFAFIMASTSTWAIAEHCH